jgi:mRNA interferase RelE/StbE
VKRVVFTAVAIKQLAKLSPDVRKRITARIDVYARSGAGDVRALHGRQGARLRVGDWRVIFQETGEAIEVAEIGHRREIYD